MGVCTEMVQEHQQPEPGVLKLYSCAYDARYHWLYVNPFSHLEYWAVTFPDGYQPPQPTTADRKLGELDWYLVQLEGYVSEVGEFGTPDYPLTRLLTVQKVVSLEKLS
jgi:hypothetical protein